MIYILLFLGAWLLIDYLYKKLPRAALKRVEFDRAFLPNRITVGQGSVVQTTVYNRKWLPLPWFRIRTIVPWQFQFETSKTVHLRQDDSCEHIVVSSLLFYEKLIRKDQFTVSKRGYYTLDGLSFETGDLLGGTSAQMTVEKPIALWVYPEVVPLSKLVMPSASMSGPVSIKRWIMPDPISPIGARDYTCQDPFSAIDWKATARVNRLQVKQLDYTANRNIMLFLDVQTQPVFWQDIRKDAVEAAVSIVVSLITESMSCKIPVGLAVNNLALDGRRIVQHPTGLGTYHYTALMDTVAMVTPHRSEEMSSILNHYCNNLAMHTVLVMITPFLSEDLKRVLNHIAKKGYLIKVFDLSLPTVQDKGLLPTIEIFRLRGDADEA